MAAISLVFLLSVKSEDTVSKFECGFSNILDDSKLVNLNPDKTKAIPVNLKVNQTIGTQSVVNRFALTHSLGVSQG